MNNQFSENLKKIRKENNISQEDLAQELGVSRQSISKWENGDAYPEMDKIIALCDKFNLNIDDLLHKDIKEVKREEASKKTINQYIDDFLNFITETVNLFSKMNFKSKVKCLFEQLLIAFVLMIISGIIINTTDSLVLSLVSFLPLRISYFISNIISNLLAVLLVLFSIIIMVHIFKTRYLNYYEEIKENKKDCSKSDEKVLSDDIKGEENTNNEKIELKKDSKIIIRDPEHSEYKFINGLFKFIIIMIKIFALCFSLSVCMTLVGLFAAFIVSFLVCKTGLFFVGIITSILSLSIIAILILLLILNFVFDRKNNKKLIIWSFIISVICFGIGCGLTFLGALDFEVLVNDDSMMDVRQVEYAMSDDFFILNYQQNITYVESDIDNVKIEYNINKYCELSKTSGSNENGIFLVTDCSDIKKLTGDFIKNVNNKKIILVTNDLDDITVYASKENISKMKKNLDDYNKMINDKYENSMEEKIESLEEEIETYRENEVKYEEKISNLEEKIEELTEE